MDEGKWYLREKCHTAWRIALQNADKSAVFIDSKAAECLHWSGGIQQLYSLEPVAICDLHTWQDPPFTNTKKAVFIFMNNYSSVRLNLGDIILKNSFTTCILITTSLESSDHELVSEIKGWMSTNTPELKVLEAKLVDFTLFFSPITDNFFTLPTVSKLPIILAKEVSYDEQTLKKNMQCLGISLHCLLMELNCSDVIYSLGTISDELAEYLEAHPSTADRRKVSSNPISVVLVDRALDLAGPSSFESDCLLDQIVTALPHLPQHCCDVAVDMSSLCHARVEDVFDETLVPGCLSHPRNTGKNLLELLIHKKQRAVLCELDQLLMGDQGDTVKAMTRAVKPQTLEKHITQFKGNYAAIMEKSSILQVCLAVTQSLIGLRADLVDRAVKYEKLLLGNLCSPHDNDIVLGQVSILITKRAEFGLSIDVLLSMLIFLYSLVGSSSRFSVEVENDMIDKLASAIHDDIQIPGIAVSILFSLPADVYTVRTVVKRFINVLKTITQSRKNLKKNSSLVKNEGGNLPVVYSPFLVQLLKDILCKSAGTSYLNTPSGGRLMSRIFGSNTPLSKKSHPADNPDILLFIIGGVTGSEVRQLQETWSRAGRSGRLLIGSTALLSPSDVLSSVLRSIPPLEEI